METKDPYTVRTAEELVALLKAISREAASMPDFENPTTERFLEAAAAWIKDASAANRFGVREWDETTWRALAVVFRAASIYE